MPVTDVTTVLVGKMLDLQTLRAETAANNIANANVVGYVPREVDFQKQLQEVQADLSRPEALTSDVESEALSFGTQPENTASLLGASTNLDGEITTLTVANTQYETLVESLNRHFGLMSLAITGREGA